MNDFTIIPVTTDQQLKALASLASTIWHEHFIPIIGEAQVDYMVEKFQSYDAVKEQIANGYEYFQIYCGDTFAGYTGIHPEDNRLFLSKLYVHQDFRGKHLASLTFGFLVNLCKERRLSSIWLTCNKHNSHTLDVYKHLGFETVDTQEANIGNGFIMDDYIMEYQLTL